jgi:hypothetical protein
MTRGTDASVVFDVLYAVGDERLVISVDEDLPRRELANEVITNVIALREDLLEVVDDLRDMADELGWSMAVATRGARTTITIS